jgi:uncharacterized protein YggE
MNNKVLTILVSVTLALVCVIAALNFISMGKDNAGEGYDTVKVSGQGKISIEPDLAYLSFGYENTDPDPQKAQDDNAKKMSEIVEALLEIGVEKENIQTVKFSVDEDYNYVNGNSTLIGYRVTNEIFVKITQLESAGEIVNTAFVAGGNVFSGIAFDVTNRDEIYMQAVDMALLSAEEKANAYAAKSDREIDRILSIDEGNIPSLSSNRYRYSSDSYAYLALAYARDRHTLEGQGVTAAPSPDSISTGMVEITADVTVVYALD